MSDIALAMQAAMNAARKAQDKDRTRVLGTVLSSLKNREIELRQDLTDADVVEVLRKQIKLRRDAVEQFEKAGRMELAEADARQIRVIEEFLPPEVDPAEIRAAVRAAMADGTTEMGKVMGKVMPAFKGRADGKVINQIVREELARE
ncbi:MAG TPA: GatB/YqeY domain-containing protein [Gemmatimonadales bacterium]|nr:GatB/YqeY domain-containing protein [Gemmatimonadales bacterium]